ncbi:MAG: hypothetical protein M0P57_00730 [Syntrophales bacterium]|nr:hypothetical protein [Syntrophales bacterium]MDY0044689.1 hypothetical protein [Syntrophales bacterium]
MKIDKWKLAWGILLIFLSIFFYAVHFIVFRDPHHLFIFFVGDIAFAFIEVLLVTMIIHELLNYRDKKSAIEKLNMVIGAFFSEAGTDLLKIFTSFDRNADKIKSWLIACGEWPEEKFEGAAGQCHLYEYNLDCHSGDMKYLQDFLVQKRGFLLNLLQNSNLLEHERFTNLLWAVFHLTEEMAARTDVNRLSITDYKHLAHDMERAYMLLVSEWLEYMKHLKRNYPYLFSLAMRTNPFDPGQRQK